MGELYGMWITLQQSCLKNDILPEENSNSAEKYIKKKLLKIPPPGNYQL